MVYNISGKIRKGTGKVYASVVVRVTNTTNDEYAEDTTDVNGDYSVDIEAFVSGYLNGDSVTIRCNSVDRDITINITKYPTGQTVNLNAYVYFLVDSNIITGIIKVSIKKSIGQSVWVASVILENKNGWRSQTFSSFEAIELYVDGNTIVKGRLRDIDLKTDNTLTLVCENKSAYLSDRFVNDEQFLSKSIYYAITDATNGLIPKYLSSLTTTNVANDINTQQTFTKTFDKESIDSCLNWLGDLASGIGYQYYVDNNGDLHFEERRVTDSDVNFTNIGSDRNVMKWDWKESSGQDIYNRIKVYGDVFDVERNDLPSQAIYGVREHPPITDTSLTTTAQANEVGDNKLTRYSLPFKDAEIIARINEPIITTGFEFLFPFNFDYTTTAKVLDVEPGSLVRVKLYGSGINDTIPEDRVVSELEHIFPLYITKLHLTEYSKDLGSIISDTVMKGYK